MDDKYDVNNILGSKIIVKTDIDAEYENNILTGTCDNVIKQENVKVYIFKYYEERTEIISAVAVALIEIKYSGKIIIIAAPADKEIYEPDIKKFIQEVENADEFKIKCLYEKTCGSVVYTNEEGIIKYLLIKNESGHIGFPKGHIEYGESEEQTAVREVFEETGIKIMPESGYRYEYTYVNNEGIHKRCVYFVSEFSNQKIILQKEEVSQFWLADSVEALGLLNYEHDRKIFTQILKDVGINK